MLDDWPFLFLPSEQRSARAGFRQDSVDVKAIDQKDKGTLRIR